MKIRIVVKPSKVRYSNLWHYDVEEKINDKWYMAYIYDGDHRFFSGVADDKDYAIARARENAKEYYELRQTHPHATQKEIVKKLTYTEEIKIG